MKTANLYIVAGKNPLSGKTGYASYSKNLCKTLKGIGITPKIFCFGPKDKIQNTEIGRLFVISSKLLSYPLFKNQEMGALSILAPKLALLMNRELRKDKSAIIWGIGPWSLAGSLTKLFFKSQVFLVADYFTSIKHEFEGTLSAINVRDYGLSTKLKSMLMYITVIQLYTLLERFLLKKSDKIITHYKSTRLILMKQFGIKNHKFAHLPYFIESRIEPEPNKITNKFQIVSISRQDGRKGINFLLHAFKIMNDKGIKYSAVLAGEGKMLEPNKKLAKILNLRNVGFPGFIKNKDELLKNATIYAFSSLEEGSSSISVLEAMACGLAIVSTDVDGISEDIETGASGLLVPPKNPASLANALEKLITNPKLLRKLGNEARRQFEMKHDPEIAKNEIKKLLQPLTP